MTMNSDKQQDLGRRLGAVDDDRLAQLRDRIQNKMSPGRWRHTIAVEQMVQRLAALYAPNDASDLRVAALLHDVTKEYSTEQQRLLCAKLQVPIEPIDEQSPKLFHAKTAAALIPVDYAAFCTPPICSCVRWHTTGRQGMTNEEKLLYLADYIDESRTFSDCVQLRTYFWGAHPENMTFEQRVEHLNRTLILSFDWTIRGLLDEGLPISLDTLAARNDLLCGGCCGSNVIE